MNNKPFVNPFHIDEKTIELFKVYTPLTTEPIKLVAGYKDSQYPQGLANIIQNLFSLQQTQKLNQDLDNQPWQPVGTNGILQDYKPGDQIGSYRASCFNQRFADLIWQKLKPLFSEVRVMHPETPTDHDGYSTWQATGINPLLRFIRYQQSGLLVPHYDAPYDYGDGEKKTLVTLVIYVQNKGITGGATRFLKDPQACLPLVQRDYRDWDRVANQNDILCSVAATPGDALMFDHRIIHDSEPVEALSFDANKTILRTDIVFQKVNQ